jgi:hypothetical protein
MIEKRLWGSQDVAILNKPMALGINKVVATFNEQWPWNMEKTSY